MIFEDDKGIIHLRFTDFPPGIWISMTDIIRVLIVDDHPFIRKGIQMVIAMELDMEVVAETNSGLEAIRLYQQTRPDVVLMDLVLPDISGIQATKEICLENPQARVLVCSNYSDDQWIISAMEAGAKGYLVKTDPPERIIQAIREMAAGNVALTRQVESTLLQYLQRRPVIKNDMHPLTSREIEILKMIARGATNTEIAEKCYISEGTVRSHIHHIQNKLGLENRAQLAIYAVKERLINP